MAFIISHMNIQYEYVYLGMLETPIHINWKPKVKMSLHNKNSFDQVVGH